jgi:signal transduction histidine kinase
MPYGMQARIEARGSPPAPRLGLRELLERVRGWSGGVGHRGKVLRETERVAVAFQFHPRLRCAALIALLGDVFLALLEARYADSDTVGALTRLGLVGALLSVAVLLASYTALGRAHLDRLALALVLGQTAILDLGYYYWPDHPGLTAALLVCLLMGVAVLFSWGARHIALLAGFICFGFIGLGWRLGTRFAGDTPIAIAAFTVMVGGVVAVGSARLLEVLRRGVELRERELAALSTRLMSLQEEERRQLSRDLHDEFGQSLTAAMAHLWLLDRQLPDDMEKARRLLGDVRRVMTQTLGAMREMSHLLRPPILDDLGLVASLEAHLRTFGEHHGIATKLVVDRVPERLSPEIEIGLYRVTQEALTNVARHAQARRVRVELVPAPGGLSLCIEDDGRGLPAESSGKGIGLIGIRERVRTLGGTVHLTSGPGLRVHVWVPTGSKLDSEVADA